MKDIEALKNMFDRAKIKYEIDQWKDGDGGSESLTLFLMRFQWNHWARGIFFEFDPHSGALIGIDE